MKLVIKIGTSSILHADSLNLRYIQMFCHNLASISESNKIIIVTSGASALGLAASPNLTPQAAASLGQIELINAYRDMFSEYNKKVAQIITTPNTSHSSRDTIKALLKADIIPIVSACDSEISTDVLSAHIATHVRAEKLIILTSSDGIYNGNPAKNPNASIISVVNEITPTLRQIATDRGLSSKVDAAEIAANGKIETIIANCNPENIEKIINNEPIGTKFCLPNF